MRKWIAAITIMLAMLCWHAEVEARCVTHTVWQDGKVVICSTCCSGNNCTTTCF